MDYQVYLIPEAAKELESHSNDLKDRIKDKLKQLKSPFIIKAKKLRGSEETYRIRVGGMGRSFRLV